MAHKCARPPDCTPSAQTPPPHRRRFTGGPARLGNGRSGARRSGCPPAFKTVCSDSARPVRPQSARGPARPGKRRSRAREPNAQPARLSSGLQWLRTPCPQFARLLSGLQWLRTPCPQSARLLSGLQWLCTPSSPSVSRAPPALFGRRRSRPAVKDPTSHPTPPTHILPAPP